ncbi:MAG: hypothetical protein ABIY63_02500 [Fibrobacteria bacterium]
MLRAACLFFPLVALCAGDLCAGASTALPAPALHLFLGQDSNACGITLPARPAASGAGGAVGPARKAARKPGLIVWLHGGMGGRNREKGLEAHRALLPFVAPGAYYLCSPSAFGGAEWPTPHGIAHIDALLDYMAAHYDFDQGDINLVGVSDGNLGIIAYSLNGKRGLHRRVLISSAPQLVLPPESLPGQARFGTGSWDFLQGGRDRLFPSDQVIPYLQRWEALYPNAHLHYFPEGEHDFSFYSENAADLLKGLLSRENGKSGRGGHSGGKPKKS